MSDDPTYQLHPRSAAARKIPYFSLGRIWTLATHTLTQLIRMKIFYFLLVFAVLVVAASNLNLLYTPIQKLRVLKDTSFGAMSVFSWLFAIAATAMLIPRDLEDRTLYTILSKPVPRLEYLVGKLLGVMLTIGIALAAMHLLFSAVLWIREIGVLGEESRSLQADPRFSPEERQAQLDLIRAQGVQWSLLLALWAIFLKATVMASITMLVSTFASSSLFTIIVSAIIFVIGHFHKLAAGFWMYETGDSLLVKLIAKPLILIIPDLRYFNAVEGIVAGKAVPLELIAQMTGLAFLYAAIYTFVALYLFLDKEF